jgi:hypothetical protein
MIKVRRLPAGARSAGRPLGGTFINIVDARLISIKTVIIKSAALIL